MFATVLVANRGEIACRVIRTLRRLGIRSVAVYTVADRGARHVTLADTALEIADYLDASALVHAATSTGAAAVHPGYGFLSENAGFARACAAAGVVFLGPSPEAIEVMGDKIRARDHVAARGVPVVPGTSDVTVDIGFPLLVKPSAGGGGKGMTVVASADDLPAALESARRIALRAFGDDTLLLERLITSPRHIEVQVLADAHGTVLSLGERECSLQRRHQKVIEEAPSPLLTDAVREAIGAAAVEVARSVDYVGAGTVEFLVSADAPDEFFFIEMNTRLQVEHPVTELVTGLDLVEWQLRIAAGEPLPAAAPPVTGHAVEARLYAEDPAAGFLPTSGTVIGLREPDGEGVRVDSSLMIGGSVASDYDPMLAKIIARGEHREQALARLDRAFAETVVQGVRTNLEFLRGLLADPGVRAGDLDTGLIERVGFTPAPVDRVAVVVAALLEHEARWGGEHRTHWGGTLWSQPSGWRLGAARPARYVLAADDQPHVVEVLGPPEAPLVDGVPVRFTSSTATATIELDGATSSYPWARSGDELWVGSSSFTLWTRQRQLAAHRATLSTVPGTASPEVRSVMPGVVVTLAVESGAAVEFGQPLLALEAMKMEHPVLAPVAGVVSLNVALGDQVRMDQLLATIEGIAP